MAERRVGRSPRGTRAGDPLTLPRLRVGAGEGAGPYRTGRAVGHAPEVLRADGRVLARRLMLRGAALTGWAAATAVWLTA